MFKKSLTLLTVALFAGCGADELNATTQEQPVTPLGTVSGQVLTTRYTPLAEAKVRLTVGTEVRTTTTNGEGSFAFGEVPAGSQVLVHVSREGYSSLHTSTVVPGSAGQFPLGGGNARVGPVLLTATGGSLKFNVTDPSGRPLTGALVRLEASPAGSTLSAEFLSRVVVESSVGADAGVLFQNIPSPLELLSIDRAGYRVWVEPLDVNADGFPDFAGLVQSFSAQEMLEFPKPRTLVVNAIGQRDGLSVLRSNVGSLNARISASANILAPNEPIRIVYNNQLAEDSIFVHLADEYGREALPVSVSLQGAGDTLVVSPSISLAPGAEYNIHVRANSLDGVLLHSTGFFFVGEPGSPVPLTLESVRYQETTAELPSRLNPYERVYVVFNQVLKRTGSAPNVQVFLTADVNGSNVIGDAVGEVGNPWNQGYELMVDEPMRPSDDVQSLFPLSSSGYSTRYSFVYPGDVSLDPSLVELSVDFDLLSERSTYVYETAWGTPARGVFAKGLQGIPYQP